MWLVNAETLELEQHEGPDVDAVQDFFEGMSVEDLPINTPSDLLRETGGARFTKVKYSILSHRWEDGEVSMRDFRDPAVRARKPGFKKIQQCCRRSLAVGIKHVWIDTCCIDKENLAELSESINSMYVWYQAAAVCFAYLSDATSSTDMYQSHWFERGWTLQELIAPRDLAFFNRDWHFIGVRHSIAPALSQRTGVDETVLRDHKPISSYSVAQRMKWTRGRVTTRAEDEAYCLIGLFSVNMPLLYGEGRSRAFRRLQEEIIRSTYDHTIFAWGRDERINNYGMIAATPDLFSPDMKLSSRPWKDGRKAYSMANGSLTITLRVAAWCTDTYLALLECANASDVESGVGIFLRRLRNETDRWVRISYEGKSMLLGNDLNLHIYGSGKKRGLHFQSRLLNVQQGALSLEAQRFLSLKRGYGFKLTKNIFDVNHKAEKRTQVLRSQDSQWNETTSVLFKPPGCWNYSDFGTIDLSPMKIKIKEIKLFLDFDFNPIIFLAEESALSSIVIKGIFDSLDQNWTAEMIAERQAFRNRRLADERGWNTVSRVNGRMVASRNDLRQGLWMLKGDRVDGLEIVLSGIAEDPNDPTVLSIKLDQDLKSDDEPRYWVVDIVNARKTGFMAGMKRIL